MFDIPCIIFAGGKSSRMGEDKALLPFGDFSTLTEFQLARLSKIFKNVHISCRSKDKFDFQAKFIEDIEINSTHAPTAGFISSFNKLGDDRFFVISVDSPLISESEILKIINSDTDEYDATIARTATGIQPMCGIYHRSLHKKFLNMFKEDNHKLGYLLKNSNTNYVDFEDERPFLNLNHPHEYQEAISLIK